MWTRGGCAPIEFETNDPACTAFHKQVYDEIGQVPIRVRRELRKIDPNEICILHNHDWFLQRHHDYPAQYSKWRRWWRPRDPRTGRFTALIVNGK